MTAEKINPSLPVIGTEEIKSLIPHRYPMLLVDRLTDVVLGESAVGIKGVTANEPFFQGHFPNHPVMPGVLIVEAMAQTAGALVVKSIGTQDDKRLVYFMSIEEARFRNPVVPGDQLQLHVKKIKTRGKIWKFEGKAYVEGKLHAEATFMAMISEGEE